jgi:hypothetical protein
MVDHKEKRGQSPRFPRCCRLLRLKIDSDAPCISMTVLVITSVLPSITASTLITAFALAPTHFLSSSPVLRRIRCGSCDRDRQSECHYDQKHSYDSFHFSSPLLEIRSYSGKLHNTDRQSLCRPIEFSNSNKAKGFSELNPHEKNVYASRVCN